jgi:hypothetical protein
LTSSDGVAGTQYLAVAAWTEQGERNSTAEDGDETIRDAEQDEEGKGRGERGASGHED